MGEAHHEPQCYACGVRASLPLLISRAGAQREAQARVGFQGRGCAAVVQPRCGQPTLLAYLLFQPRFKGLGCTRRFLLRRRMQLCYELALSYDAVERRRRQEVHHGHSRAAD